MSAQQAHARRSDPATSHDAAEIVSPALPALQALVEEFARDRPAGFLDVDLVEAYPDLGPSTLRTRRSELCARNIILDSRCRRRPNVGVAPHTVWIHRAFATGFVPDVCDPDKPAAPPIDVSRHEALTMAAKLDTYAATSKAEGRSFLGSELAEAARIMRGLVR